jgi:hypothetical protein
MVSFLLYTALALNFSALAVTAADRARISSAVSPDSGPYFVRQTAPC